MGDSPLPRRLAAAEAEAGAGHPHHRLATGEQAVATPGHLQDAQAAAEDDGADHHHLRHQVMEAQEQAVATAPGPGRTEAKTGRTMPATA